MSDALTSDGRREDVPYRHSSDVVHRVVEGQAVLVNLASGACFELDRIGTRIWELVGEGLPASRVLEALLDEYEADRGEVEIALRRLLDDLLSQGLIFESEKR